MNRVPQVAAGDLRRQRTAIRNVLHEGIARLETAHVPSAGLAAELLLMHATGRNRTWLYAHPEEEVGGEARERFLVLVARRAEGTPTQYLAGHQEFWGLEFEVTPDVLIPRPETEHVVEVALARFRDRWSDLKNTQLRIADIGTGSGCLAVALANELPNARFVATDISLAALSVARRNAARHGVASRVEFVECNLLDTTAREFGAHDIQLFDLIVSNPPYVARDDAATLPREVRDHEPHVALFAGESGLDFYAPLVNAAETLLVTGGALVVELGYNSAKFVRALLSTVSWRDVRVADDLAGMARVASAVRAGGEP